MSSSRNKKKCIKNIDTDIKWTSIDLEKSANAYSIDDIPYIFNKKTYISDEFEPAGDFQERLFPGLDNDYYDTTDYFNLGIFSIEKNKNQPIPDEVEEEFLNYLNSL